MYDKRATKSTEGLEFFFCNSYVIENRFTSKSSLRWKNQMSVTVGIAVMEFVVVSVGCWLLLRYYKSPMVTMDVVCTVYLSWVMGFATVLLLPYDLSIAITLGTSSTSLLEMWKVVYWRYFNMAAVDHQVCHTQQHLLILTASFLFFLLTIVPLCLPGWFCLCNWNSTAQATSLSKIRYSPVNP